MTEVLFTFSYRCDVTALTEDLHDELLGGVLRQTPDEYRLTPRGALSCGGRRKVWAETRIKKKEKKQNKD